MSIEARPKVVVSVGLMCVICSSREKGASFCQVDKIKPVIRSSPWRTSGSQKCTGARPSLRARAKVAMEMEAGTVKCSMAHCPVTQALVVLAKRIMAAAVAWVMKYLVVASTARG